MEVLSRSAPRGQLTVRGAAARVCARVAYYPGLWVVPCRPSERGCQLTYVNTIGPAPRDPEHIKLVKGYVPNYETDGEPPTAAR